MAKLNMDLSEYDEGFDLIPPKTEEEFEIISGEVKQGQKGRYINWVVVACGKYAGKRIWDNMSLTHEVGLRRLKAMATACGHKNPNYIADTDELVGKRFIGVVGIEIDKNGQFEDKNKITAFKAKGGTKPKPQDFKEFIDESKAMIDPAPESKVTIATPDKKMPWE